MRPWQDLLQMLHERRIGFRVEQTMKGSHRFLVDHAEGKVAAGTELPFSFHAAWGHPRLQQYLNPLADDFLFAVMEGTVSAGGITGEAPMKGSLQFRYLAAAAIRFAFDFEAQGRTFRHTGEMRKIRPWNLHRTHTRCHGTLTDLTHGREISTSLVRFDLGTLLPFLLSFRLV